MFSSKRIIIVITFFVLFSAIILLAPKAYTQEPIVATGVIQANEWDEEGQVFAALLVVVNESEDEEGEISTYTEEYQIYDDEIGQQLFELDGTTVEVHGTLMEEEDGTVIIEVKSFKIIQEENTEQND